MLTVLIMVAPVVVCFLYGMYLDERPANTRRDRSGSATEADGRPTDEGSVLDRDAGGSEQAAQPFAGGSAPEVRAKRTRFTVREPARLDTYTHPTAVPLSMQWTALDQIQLERVLQAAAQRSR
jgi:hypothetical protein